MEGLDEGIGEGKDVASIGSRIEAKC